MYLSDLPQGTSSRSSQQPTWAPSGGYVHFIFYLVQPFCFRSYGYKQRALVQLYEYSEEASSVMQIYGEEFVILLQSFSSIIQDYGPKNLKLFFEKKIRLTYLHKYDALV